MFLNFGERRREERKEGGKDGGREEKKRKGGWGGGRKGRWKFTFFFHKGNPRCTKETNPKTLADEGTG